MSCKVICIFLRVISYNRKNKHIYKEEEGHWLSRPGVYSYLNSSIFPFGKKILPFGKFISLLPNKSLTFLFVNSRWRFPKSQIVNRVRYYLKNMYRKDKLKKGEILYKGQTTEKINMKGDLYNPEHNKNWNYSLYFFTKPDPCWNYNPESCCDVERKIKEKPSFWIIKYTLLNDLKIVFSDDDYFKGIGGMPLIKDIAEETEKVIKKPMHYEDPENEYPFMRILGEKKYAFSCYENEYEDEEVIIPYNLLQEGHIFKQEIYACI